MPIARLKKIVLTLLIIVGIYIASLIEPILKAPVSEAVEPHTPGVPSYNLECHKGVIILPERMSTAVLVVPPCNSDNDAYTQWVELPNPEKHFKLDVFAQDNQCAPIGA